MSLLDETRYLLKKYHLRPDTDRGQNFLISEVVLKNIVDAGNITSRSTVLEIGAGLGTLTTALALQAKKVVSIESDRNLQPLLTTLAQSHKNIEFMWADFSHLSWPDVEQRLGKTYSIVANIPYYITGLIIEQVMIWPIKPKNVVFLVQWEVGQKYIAQPGQLSKQSLAVQFYAEPEIISRVPARAFWPAPKVDSAILRLGNIHDWDYRQPEKSVWQLIRIGFSSKRKKLINNLAAGLQIDKDSIISHLEKLGIDVNARAEDLTKEQWVALTQNLKVKT